MGIVYLPFYDERCQGKTEFPFEKIYLSEFREYLEKKSSLTSIEIQVLKHRFGFEGDILTLEECGRVIQKHKPLSIERIRQIEGKALKRLRHPSEIIHYKDNSYPDYEATNHEKIRLYRSRTAKGRRQNLKDLRELRRTKKEKEELEKSLKKLRVLSPIPYVGSKNYYPAGQIFMHQKEEHCEYWLCQGYSNGSIVWEMLFWGKRRDKNPIYDKESKIIPGVREEKKRREEEMEEHMRQARAFWEINKERLLKTSDVSDIYKKVCDFF